MSLSWMLFKASKSTEMSDFTCPDLCDKLHLAEIRDYIQRLYLQIAATNQKIRGVLPVFLNDLSEYIMPI